MAMLLSCNGSAVPAAPPFCQNGRVYIGTHDDNHPAGHERREPCVYLEMESMLILGVAASLVAVAMLAITPRRSRQRRSELMAPGRTVIAANLVGSRWRRGL
jgi:hypothetical protein